MLLARVCLSQSCDKPSKLKKVNHFVRVGKYPSEMRMTTIETKTRCIAISVVRSW